MKKLVNKHEKKMKIEVEVDPLNFWFIDEVEAENRSHIFNNSLCFYRQCTNTFKLEKPSVESQKDLDEIKNMLHLMLPQKFESRYKSTVRGKEGEESFDEIISNHFPHLDLVDTSHIPHRGDRILKGDTFKIMIEYKNYTTNVGVSQVKKFERDVNMVKPDVAVLYSMNTPFTCLPKTRVSFRNVENCVCVFVPSGGREGDRLLYVLEWAEFLAKNRFVCEDKCFDMKRVIAQSQRALASADSLARELNIISENLHKQLQNLDRAHHSSLGRLREQLKNIIPERPF
jgi:hypothetical protein